MTVEYTDTELIRAWEFWSEEYYAAGFMSPMDGFVDGFMRWLRSDASREYFGERSLGDYEIEMLQKVRARLKELV